MSATDISTLPQESKQQDFQSGKDDQKQQAALRKKETKQTKEVPVDAGSSLVGGAVSAVQHAVESGIHMLPESLQTRATDLQSNLTAKATDLAQQAAPILDSYQKDGLIAAAKTAGGIGAGAATNLKKQVLDKKDETMEKKPIDKQEPIEKKEPIQKDAAAKQPKAKKAAALKEKIPSAAELKEKIPSAAELKEKIPSAADLKQKIPSTADLKQKIPSTAELKEQGAAAAATLKEKLPASLLNKLPTAESLQQTAASLKEKLPVALTSKLPVALGGEAAAETPVVAPKHKGRRRRGGRGHGNRKLKTRALGDREAESIKDSLGDKAAEIKDILVEDVAKIEAAAPGIIGNIRGQAAGLVSGVTNTVSSSINSARSAASGIVAAGQSKIATLTGNAKEAADETLEVNNLKPKSIERKPTLERRDELPALGTPNTPNDKDVTFTKDGKMAVNAAGAGTGVLGTAAFYGNQLMDAIKEKVEDFSANADDDKPMSADEQKEGALDKAKQQLAGMKDAVLTKVDAAKEVAKSTIEEVKEKEAPAKKETPNKKEKPAKKQ